MQFDHLQEIADQRRTAKTEKLRALRLEREEFMRLVRTEGTLARIAHTLETGKPLRN